MSDGQRQCGEFFLIKTNETLWISPFVRFIAENLPNILWGVFCTKYIYICWKVLFLSIADFDDAMWMTSRKKIFGVARDGDHLMGVLISDLKVGWCRERFCCLDRNRRGPSSVGRSSMKLCMMMCWCRGGWQTTITDRKTSGKWRKKMYLIYKIKQ